MTVRATIDHMICKVLEAPDDKRMLWRLEVVDCGLSSISETQPYAHRDGGIIWAPQEVLRFLPRDAAVLDGVATLVVLETRHAMAYELTPEAR